MLRYTLRTLRRSPIFTAVAILSIALGIGANTAIYSVLHQVLLRSLPVQEPGRLVHLEYKGVFEGHTRADAGPVFTYPIYESLREKAASFDGLIARAATQVNFISGDEPDMVQAETVSGNFFPVLGVRPVLGRLLAPADDLAPYGQPVVVLSHQYWMQHFGGSASALNQTVRVNGVAMAIVGVVAQDFRGIIPGQKVDVYLPLHSMLQILTGFKTEDRRSAWLSLIGRLKPGIKREQAEIGLIDPYRSIMAEDLQLDPRGSSRFREQYVQNRVLLHPASQGLNQLSRRWKQPLIVIGTMVGLVLLIACANVAGLLIARAAGQRRQMAIRISLGATRWHLIRQQLTESVLLSLTGGALGLALSYWLTWALVSMLPGQLGGWLEAKVDTRLMIFAFLLSLAVGIAFGLIPSMSGSAVAVINALKEQVSSATKGQLRLRRVMVAAQIALSVVLVCGAGLFARSFANLMNVDAGFRSEKLLVFSVDPFRAGHRGGSTIAIFERLQQRLKSLPGVNDVSIAQLAPMGGDLMGGGISVEGYQPGQDEEVYSDADLISPGYFRTMGIPLIAGREFTEADRGAENKKAIVNDAFAQKYLKGRNPIGSRMLQSIGNVRPDIEIVGVVKNFKFGSLRDHASPFYYRPYLQRPEVRGMRMFVRTSYENNALAAEARRVVREMDANMPVVNARWMDAQVADSVYLERLMAALVSAFGILALCLAAVGLYGVIAYLTARRTLEIGIRMALGATKQSVLRLVLRDALVLAGAGLLIGIPCALAAGRLVQSQLFGVQAYDPAILIGAVLILSAVAMASGYVPARRAAAIDPMRALRSE